VSLLQPTNGDERHLNYFALYPEAMRSQLATWVAHAQNSDGSYYCIIVSGANNAQYGNGDPCGTPSPSNPHPDDITMVLVAAYEQLALANDTELITSLYPSLLRGFSYYIAHFNTSAWSLPYEVHETYDAVSALLPRYVCVSFHYLDSFLFPVPESSTITGEGNLGTSLFNALQYLTGIHCMLQIAGFMQEPMRRWQPLKICFEVATLAIEENLWQGGSSPFYIGDTIQGNAYLTEANGWSYHSSDGLHGQALSYRLGFGDLLPRLHMALHQGHVLQVRREFCAPRPQNDPQILLVFRILDTSWGLRVRHMCFPELVDVRPFFVCACARVEQRRARGTQPCDS